MPSPHDALNLHSRSLLSYLLSTAKHSRARSITGVSIGSVRRCAVAVGNPPIGGVHPLGGLAALPKVDASGSFVVTIEVVLANEPRNALSMDGAEESLVRLDCGQR